MLIYLIAIIGGLLVSPFLWFGISFLCSGIPFMAEFLSEIFWEILGNVPCFAYAANILETALQYPFFSGSHFLLTFLEMLFGNIVDSFVMGLSVFFFKSLFARFNRHGLLVIPGGWAATVLGVAFGALMTAGKSVLPGGFQGLFSFVLCLGLMCFGIGMMLGKPVRAYYAEKKTRSIAGMLMKILVDANLAWTCVSLAVCSLEGPRIVQSTGNVKLWAAWYGVTILAYFVLDSIIFFLSPSLRNSM